MSIEDLLCLQITKEFPPVKTCELNQISTTEEALFECGCWVGKTWHEIDAEFLNLHYYAFSWFNSSAFCDNLPCVFYLSLKGQITVHSAPVRLIVSNMGSEASQYIFKERRGGPYALLSKTQIEVVLTWIEFAFNSALGDENLMNDLINANDLFLKLRCNN